MIDCFFEFLQGFYHLPWQHEADPDAQQKREPGDNAEHPFCPIKKMASFLVVLLDTRPASGLQFAGCLQNFRARRLERRCDLSQDRISSLHRTCDLAVKGTDLVAEVIDELNTSPTPALLQ